MKNKQASTQTTIDNKVNKNMIQKNNNNQNNTNCKNETKGIIIKTNNNCQTKNHILRKKKSRNNEIITYKCKRKNKSNECKIK